MNGRERGLRFKDTDFVWFNEGAYGTIFVNHETKRVRKVYRRATDKTEEHCQKVFYNEWAAMEIASSDTFLSELIAAPVQRIASYAIIDRNGGDVTGDFLKDACYEQALIERTFQKIGTVTAGNLDQLRQAFRTAGIHHFIDASVTLSSNGNIEKVIDIATEEIELMW